MEHRLLPKRTSDVEDWSDDFSLIPPAAAVASTPTYPSLSHLEVDLTAVMEDDGGDGGDDDDEDWDTELTFGGVGSTVTTAVDAKGLRDENNSFFRSLLTDTTSDPSSVAAAAQAGYTLPETYRLVENAKHCFKQQARHRHNSLFPQATPLLTLEHDGFPHLAEKQLEEWLCQIITSKEQAALALEKQWSLNAHGHLPTEMTKDVWQRFAQLLSFFVRRRQASEALQLVRAFVRRLEGPFLDVAENQRKRSGDHEWWHIRGGWSAEILQIAADVCRPPQHTALFVRAVRTCHQLFPTWSRAMALVECRYVGHHWAHWSQHRYAWAVPSPTTTMTPLSFATEFAMGQELLTRYAALLSTLVDESDGKVSGGGDAMAGRAPSSMATGALEAGLLSLSTHPLSLQVLVLCDVQDLAERQSPVSGETIPYLFVDDGTTATPVGGGEPHMESSVVELFHPEATTLRMEWLEGLYVKLAMPHDVLIKAKCAHVLSRSMLAHTDTWALCESLSMEALRLLDIGYPLSFPKCEGQRHGLIGHLGREVLEILGAVLAQTKKYRFAIAAYEAAQQIYSFQHLTRRGYEKLDRLCSGLCLQEGDLDRALQYHDRVLQWTKEHENCNEFVYITQMINSILLQQSHFRLAEHRLQEALMALRDPQAVLPPPFAKGAPRRFHFKFSSPGYDVWFQHDIQLHLCLHDVFKGSGRGQDALHVLQHVLSYEPRFKLPRGKRMLLTMMVAEDALKLRQLELCISMLRTIEHDVMVTDHDTSVHESKLAWDIMGSFRYLKCRARCYFYKSQFHRCALWLAVATAKGLTVRQKADVHALVGRSMLRLHEKLLQEANDDAPMPVQRSASGRWCFTSQEPSLSLLLNKKEQEVFQLAMEEHWSVRSFSDACAAACWKAFDMYGTLNDPVRQLKMVLTLVRLETSVVEASDGSDDVAFKHATAYAKQALELAAECAVPMKMLQALVYTAWLACWRLRVDPDSDSTELTTTTDEALRLLQATYLRRVDGAGGSIHVVPLLPFPPSVLVQLEHIVGKLLVVAAHHAAHLLPLPTTVFTWPELESAYNCLNQYTYWYSAQPERRQPTASAADETTPAFSRPSHKLRARQPSQQHQKQLSLSSLSDMMMPFALFRRTDSFSCDVHDVPPPSPFAYVEPIKASAPRGASPVDQRSRSHSAPAANDDDSVSNSDWDEADLEVEADGADFWRACNQEYRKQHALAARAGVYTDDTDALWGIWYSHKMSDLKYKSGRLTASAFRLASLRLIFDILQQSDPHTSRVCLPPTPGIKDSWGIIVQDRDRVTVISHPPTYDPIAMTSFAAASSTSWRQHFLNVPFAKQAAAAVTPALVERVLHVLGPKVLTKVLSSILLETPLIVVHSSLSVVQDVLYVLLHLLRPFQWTSLVLPALPMTSTSMLVDLVHAFADAKTNKRPKSDASPPPFLAGISLDMWRECTYRLSAIPTCATCVSVLQVDVAKFQKASNRAVAVHMQPKLRRVVVDAVAASPTAASLEAALDEVYRVILQSFEKPPSFKQWLRLESQEFTKLFQATALCQSHLGRLHPSVV
ncbi:Aste57867_24421 [Aphanomyces stellatus]|uniref:Aste57867_24421 protein n=1 Tax=Aphanomyces stellatus TaxID=120398 RepID=A0A485LUQ9_9STRA|nr:hypothetical protein As57867_024345 [Aphanomyces stellatus]VFU01061.1 Aste57867_24421 [Aphanomyces stellatus]